ncbi:MAG TPA: hypothetical protein VK890_10185 [Bacteroidia bacterium]|jgi:hypothetical protein|nr:hypothetical protein [Bacteroidia bacterium]
MNSIEIFKTNVRGKRNALYLIGEMNAIFPGHKVSIDLDDKDKVLRVENSKGKVKSSDVIKLLEQRNFHCEVLNY